MFKMTLRMAASTFLLLKRVVLGFVLLAALVAAGLLLSLRYSVLPDIEKYHDDITLAVGKAIGLTIEIGRIEADMRGLEPHMLLTDIRVLDKQKRTTLALKKIDIVVSWMTVLTGKLRLASLELDRPELMVKRDAKGVLQISGVQIGESEGDDDSADLLLHQSRLVVRDAKISWLDEKQAAPLLVFNEVNLLIENGWNVHRFAVRATPPAKLATRLDVRGSFYGKKFDDLQDWSGEVYTELEYADLAAWKTWLPIPEALKRGSGALRGWMTVEAGKISKLTTDLALVDVQTRLGEDLPPLNIRVLSGRLGWRDVAQGVEVSLNKFSLKLLDNFVLNPTDVLVRLNSVQEKQAASGEVNANFLELEGLGKLLEYLPVERRFKKQFAAFSPHGRVENLKAKWQTGTDDNLSFKVKGKFAALSLQRVDNLPGFSGLSGDIDGNEKQGNLFINSPGFRLDAPQIMPQQLSFDTVAAQLGWQANAGGVEVKLRNVSVANADLAGTAYGSYQTVTNSPGKVDVTVHLSRAKVSRAGAYIPLVALGQDARKWIGQALLEGESNDFNLRLKGDLNDFPFADNRSGIFRIHARAKGVALEYAADWPRIEKAAADLLIQGKVMTVTAASAMTAGVRLKNTQVSIPDVLSDRLMLHIGGEAEAENASVLNFVNVSPVRGYIDGFTDDIVARGNGKLKISLELPLSDARAIKVSGSYHFTDGEIEMGKNLPTLRKVNGDLKFTESGVSTNNIIAQILGGPAKLMIESGASGAMNIKLGGRANFDQLSELNALPLLRKFSGEPAWNADISVQDKLGKVLITSSMDGFQSALPEPFAKQAKEPKPLRIEIKDLSSSREFSTVQYGSLLNAGFLRIRDDDSEWKIKSGAINFGDVEKKSGRDGIWISGKLALLSLDGWKGLSGSLGDDESEPVRIREVDLSIQKLTGFGSQVNDLHINAHTRNGVLAAHLAAREINGDVSWQAGGWQTGALNPGENGRLLARLKNLDLGSLESDEQAIQQTESTNGEKVAAGVEQLPSIDLSIDRLSFKGRPMGRLEFVAHQREHDYLLDRLSLVNPDGVLTVDGKWKMSEETPQTQVNLKLEISNAGNILSRYGYPNSVKNGSGKLDGIFSWPGTPGMLNKAELSGKLNLNTGKGQFLQIDPGMGKLLSILSLQALPKRITLDFEDVFSKGFEFENINGTAEIKQGVMSTDNLRIEGTAAKISMAGQIDLENETQNLKVRVIPTVGNSAALLSALVATPVIGAGVFLASKILGDPLGQLASFEYNVTGSWADPKVEKAGETKPAKKPEN
jgi:uncharacterized protein (TIGR02099 family)